jgi:hypothetical protein
MPDERRSSPSETLRLARTTWSGVGASPEADAESAEAACRAAVNMPNLRAFAHG